MKSTKEIETYLDLEGHKEQTPNRNPTALDVFSHIRFMGKELALAGTKGNTGGYAYIVDNEDEWRQRTGDPTATIPPDPVMPEEPPEEASTGEWKRHDNKKDDFKEYKKIRTQVLKFIQQKFPTMLIDMEDPVYGFIVGDVTPKQAYKHMLDSLLDPRKERALFVSVQKQMATLNYTPNGVGPKEYMRDLLDLHFKTRQLKDAGQIDAATLYTYALEAFRRCGHDLSTITKLEDTWILEEAQLQAKHKLALQTDHAIRLQQYTFQVTAAPNNAAKAAIPVVPALVVTRRDVMSNFIAYWTKHLARLYQDEPPKSRANMVTTADIDELRSQIGDLINDQHTLAQAYNTVLKQPPADIPSIVSTNPGSSMTPQTTPTAFNAQQLQQQIANAVAAALSDRSDTHQGGRGRGRGRGRANNANATVTNTERIQWKYWCYSCGANLTHNTRECTRDHKWEGHEQHLDAKKGDPQGGNKGRDRLLMRWFDPVTKKGYDSPTSST